MEYFALFFAFLAFLVATSAAKKGGVSKQDLDDARRDARRDAQNLAEEVKRELDATRALLAEVAAGTALDRDQILEGRLWRDVDAREGQQLVEGGEKLHLLDVRSPGETATGIIPGAQLIPIEQLEARLAEVPKGAGAMLVYCAGGGRSAAACELLSSQGYAGLHNLAGGMGSWSGPVARPNA
jgi:rhodanese-related sulfurtransferase